MIALTPPMQLATSIAIGSLLLIILAFLPFAPGVDAIHDNTTTLNCATELLLLATGTGLATLAVLTLTAPIVYRPSFAVIVVGWFAIWAMVTAIWSPNPILTVGKGLELSLIVIAASLVVRLSNTVVPRGVTTNLTKAFLLAIVCLLVANLLVRKTLIPVEIDSNVLISATTGIVESRPRATFAYASPLLIGDILALTIICLISSNIHLVIKFVVCSLAAWGVWMTDSRTALITIPLVLILMAINRIRNSRARLAIGLMTGLSLILLVLAIHWQQANNLESAAAKDIYTLNGRIDLWQDVIPLIQDNWLVGIGFYASRYVLVQSDRLWAGHTHNSFLEVTFSTGMIGMIICAIFIGYVVWTIWRTRDGLLLGTFVYCMIIGNTNPLIFCPVLQMFVLLVALINASTHPNSN